MNQLFESLKSQYLNTTMETMLLASVTISILLPLVILIVKKGFKWVWEGITQAAGLIFNPAKVVGLAIRFRWVIHFTVQILILVGLGFINYRLDVIRYLESPSFVMRALWLPLLYLVVYLLAWTVWWLRLVLTAEEEISEYFDIDLAWNEAVQAVAQAGIDLKQVPIFLVLGKSGTDEAEMFTGAQLTFTVEQVPRQPAPLHVYASEQALFVTCTGASLLGQQAQQLTAVEEPAAAKEEADDKAPVAAVAAPPATPVAGREKDTLPIKAEPAAAAPPGQEAAAGPATEIEKKETPAVKPLPAVPLIKSRPEMERLSARLKHLCWLILQQRKPYCPINGILLVLPFAATDNETRANQTGLVCRQDLLAIQEVMQVRCPVFALVADMEATPGFRDLIARFPAAHRQRRLGQAFPYIEEGGGNGDILDQGVDWICLELFPPLIYRMMRLGRAAADKRMTGLRGNVRLYNLMCEMRARRKYLSRLLALAVTLPQQPPVLFGGCYFAGTGRDPAREQAFIPAVFHRLLESQSYVAWTKNAVDEERRYRRLTVAGFAGVGVLAATFLGCVVFLAFFR